MSFRVCGKCDFEWNIIDSNECPVCTNKRILKQKSQSDDNQQEGAGVFISAEKSKRVGLWVKALGLLVLVYLIHQLLS